MSDIKLEVGGHGQARIQYGADGRGLVFEPEELEAREELVSEDAVALWEAAGRPLTLDDVCPQRFRAPLAPHLSARAEGRHMDVDLLRNGISRWEGQCDLIVVEGSGGLMSPISDDEYVADLAFDFGYPVVVVAPNKSM